MSVVPIRGEVRAMKTINAVTIIAASLLAICCTKAPQSKVLASSDMPQAELYTPYEEVIEMYAPLAGALDKHGKKLKEDLIFRGLVILTDADRIERGNISSITDDLVYRSLALIAMENQIPGDHIEANRKDYKVYHTRRQIELELKSALNRRLEIMKVEQENILLAIEDAPREIVNAEVDRYKIMVEGIANLQDELLSIRKNTLQQFGLSDIERIKKRGLAIIKRERRKGQRKISDMEIPEEIAESWRQSLETVQLNFTGNLKQYETAFQESVKSAQAELKSGAEAKTEEYNKFASGLIPPFEEELKTLVTRTLKKAKEVREGGTLNEAVTGIESLQENLTKFRDKSKSMVDTLVEALDASMTETKSNLEEDFGIAKDKVEIASTNLLSSLNSSISNLHGELSNLVL